MTVRVEVDGYETENNDCRNCGSDYCDDEHIRGNGVMVASHRVSPTKADVGRCFIMHGK